MPKGTNQKLKLYRLAQIMLEQTDDEHYITMAEIMEALRRYDITADRKSLYNDLRDLSSFGIEVEGESVGNRYHYHVVSRPFELPELKLLVDAIQSSKFITEKKTNILIKKLEKLVSKYDAQKLQRQVYVSGRIKTMNESIRSIRFMPLFLKTGRSNFNITSGTRKRKWNCGIMGNGIISAHGDSCGMMRIII